ncbi:NEDD4-binding protein 1 isoform X2 [Anguilla rostrata]|uniref:NEDD4-binding protein 1 isoform X2 n=1 Tax=Anguilla rostrata TaxID=7938 RepID=UPI0030D4F1CC
MKPRWELFANWQPFLHHIRTLVLYFVTTADESVLLNKMERAGWVEDEFACHRGEWGRLRCVWPLVERVFGVQLDSGGEGGMETLATDGQMWLKMKGSKKEVEEAKLFVKGQVNEAMQQQVSYPELLYSVFCGAGGLFLDCIMKYTCAFVQVGPPGNLIISGLEEPVVRACSLILDLVEKYEHTQGWSTEAGAGPAGGPLDSCRAFRSLVEKWEDQHTLELLGLPAQLKETLLALVKESGLDPAKEPHRGPAAMDRVRERQREGEREGEREREKEEEREGESEEFLVRQKEKQVWQREGVGATPEHSEQLRGRERRRGKGAHTHTPSPTQLHTPHAPLPRKTTPPSVRGPPQHPDPPAPLTQPTTAHRTKHFTPATIVTGEQRFHEGLQTPFDLQLADDPGDPNLSQVIIDGSNVAMSHGLGLFFSCRGIALAVQYFWNRGHRRVTTFVPRWRQRKDPRVKEYQYLSQLQNLGCLSFTPSREVPGKIISSYDDRFMLQLAQETNGVIVTNDNLRDLLDESPDFNRIIRNRLLQYTFVGDHFMVPDDPLGRAGPHLNDFLRSRPRSPASGSHTGAGLAPPFSSTPQVSYRHAQTEALQDHSQPAGAAGRQRQAADPAVLREHLLQRFPGQDSLVTLAIQCNPDNNDITSLSHIIQSMQRERAEDR